MDRDKWYTHLQLLVSSKRFLEHISRRIGVFGRKTIASTVGGILIGGDFNARYTEWDLATTDKPSYLIW